MVCRSIPGTLLMMGYLGDVPVVGAPGCIKSPKTNVIDWILPRLLSGERLTRANLVSMGHGGLLKDIAERPMPRSLTDGPTPPPTTLFRSRAAAVGALEGQCLRDPGIARVSAPIILAAGSFLAHGSRTRLLLPWRRWPADGGVMSRHEVRSSRRQSRISWL